MVLVAAQMYVKREGQLLGRYCVRAKRDGQVGELVVEKDRGRYEGGTGLVSVRPNSQTEVTERLTEIVRDVELDRADLLLVVGRVGLLDVRPLWDGDRLSGMASRQRVCVAERID